MQLRKNFLIKFLAFLLAVLCLAGCAVLACLQIMEIDVLWDGRSPIGSRQVYRLMAEDFDSIRYMVSLQHFTEPTALQKERLAELEERFHPENTNLRWQIRDAEDDLLYGNAEGELPAAAYDSGYWRYFTMDDTFSAMNVSGNWLTRIEGLYTAEELPAQIRAGDWLAALTEAVTQWQAGDRTVDPDAVFLGEDGTTDLLIIDTSGGTTVYAPTVRSTMEINDYGFRYELSRGQWIRRVSSKEHHIVMWLDGDLRVQDKYKEAAVTAQNWYFSRDLLLIATAAAALAWLLLTVCLCVWSGWRKGHEEISLCWFHRIPGDLLLAGYLFLFALFGVLLSDNAYSLWETTDVPLWGQLTAAGLFGGAASLLSTSFLVTFCARCKGRVLLRNMIVVRILVGFLQILRTAAVSLPLIWKTALGGLAYVGISFLLWLAVLNSDGFGWVLTWLLLSLLAVACLCRWALHWRRLREGTEAIIAGSSERMDTAGMPHDLKEHADELNNLGETISSAVEERMRSEHFKTELITNVSHDLKTPLTSIISYVDLLKKENIGNPRAAEYIEVLDRKSQRLKKLTEDLVEASKASTGNLTVNAERLDLVQLIDQALAEYQERLDAHGLSVVRTLPSQPVRVRADGRHLWRVADNLLSNCAKYSLEGTRVYVEVEQYFDCAELRVKNISREALNMDSGALMERFVRGDESRTTEGSGLGLSIARSLTELQGGTFHVDIDGDLFKATVRLPPAD